MVKVSVTVKNHKITAIKVLSNSDDAAFFNRASAGVIKNILAKQSLKVDVVSGATYSSNGIIKAVKNALTGEEDKSSAKAGGWYIYWNSIWISWHCKSFCDDQKE